MRVKTAIKKNIANLLTISRMVLSLLLLPLLNHPAAYVTVYALCGLTDALDGPIARSLKSESSLGARLDSIADLIMFVTITVSMVIWAGDLLMRLLLLIIAVFFIRVGNVMIAYFKYKALVLLHTWGNKLTGFALFLTPLLTLLTHSFALLAAIGGIALMAALEETAIHLTTREYDLNRKSLFFK